MPRSCKFAVSFAEFLHGSFVLLILRGSISFRASFLRQLARVAFDAVRFDLVSFDAMSLDSSR